MFFLIKKKKDLSVFSWQGSDIFSISSLDVNFLFFSWVSFYSLYYFNMFLDKKFLDKKIAYASHNFSLFISVNKPSFLMCCILFSSLFRLYLPGGLEKKLNSLAY